MGVSFATRRFGLQTTRSVLIMFGWTSPRKEDRYVTDGWCPMFKHFFASLCSKGPVFSYLF